MYNSHLENKIDMAVCKLEDKVAYDLRQKYHFFVLTECSSIINYVVKIDILFMVIQLLSLRKIKSQRKLKLHHSNFPQEAF